MSDETIPRAWLREKRTVAQIERFALSQIDAARRELPGIDIPRMPFGKENYRWEEFKRALRPGDEIWEFQSPQELWDQGQGKVGFVALRGGRKGFLVASLMMGDPAAIVS